MGTTNFSLPLSDILPVSVVVSPAAVPGLAFNEALICGPSNVIPTVGNNQPRLRLYTSVDAMLEDGFSTSSPEYNAATLYFGQTPAPFYLWIGRQNLSALGVVAVGSSGGSGYLLNDILTVVQSGASGGQVQVTSTGTNVAATTTATAAFGTTTVVVASSAGIGVGDTITGTGIPGATTVSTIVGNTLTISAATTATLLNAPLTFTVTTTGSASSGSVNLTVASATGIAVGQTVSGTGIAAGTTVISAVSTAITLSQGTLAVLSSGSVTFTQTTTGTAQAGTLTLTVASGTSIAIGQTVSAVGVPAGTLVTNIVSTTVTLSAYTTAALSTTTAVFTTIGIVTGIQLYPNNQGTNYSNASNLATTGGFGTGAQVTITGTGETPLQAMVACRNQQSAWYACMFVGTAQDSDHVAIAQFIESASPNSMYFLTSGSSTILQNAPGNLFATLQGLRLRRTWMEYATTSGGEFPTNIYASAAPMGVGMGRNTGAAGSYFDIMFKPIAEVGPESLTQTQVNTIAGTVDRSQQGLNGNIMVSYNNNTYQWIQNATMASGVFFDEVLFLDVLANDIQISGVNYLVSQPVVPITNAGVTQMANVVAGACARSQAVGFIAPSGVWLGPNVGGNAANGIKTGAALPNGYYVYAPSVQTLSPAARAARQMPPFTVLLIESQSGHSLSVTVLVQQ